ncbi:MAG TPA: type II secretion system F family protein [Pirellulales bacterium]|nr:type II secretion system F family protein [Pirellulales bacterium]
MFPTIGQVATGLCLLGRTASRRASWDPSTDLQIYGAAAAVLIGLNLVLAIRYWRPYFKFVRFVGLFLLSLFLLGMLIGIAGVFGAIAWAGIVVAIITLMVQLPRARRRLTLDALTLAVEKRLPLPAVVGALASDRWFGGRMWRLASKLDSGVPLAAALAADPGLVSHDALVAAQMGEATGDLAGALRQAEADGRLRTPLLQVLVGHSLYLAALAICIPFVAGFMLHTVAPKFIGISDQFQIPLPTFFVDVVRTGNSYAWIGYCVPFAAVAVMLYFLFCYADVFPLAVLGQGSRFERRRILRTLALAAETGRPLGESLAALAKAYPRNPIAKRLQAVADETRAGANWTISLLKHRLIGVQDTALLEAAQRLGNVPWALREAADSSERRLVYRLEWLVNIVSPIVVLAWGVVVLVAGVACLSPLTSWIMQNAE